MQLNLDWEPFLDGQWDGFNFDAPKGQIAVTAFLGGWGSGKTHGAARKFLRRVCEAPKTDAYGLGAPKSLIVAPTFKVLQQATLAQFVKLCPSEVIAKRRGPPYNDVWLINGHQILLHSGEAEIEGMDAVCVWIDEVHKPVFSSNPTRYLNLLARLRDPFAEKKEMIVSGLPTAGWVRDTFSVAAPNRKTVLMPTKSNAYMDRALIDVFYQNCPGGQEKTLLGGQWMSPEGAIYVQFDAAAHLTPHRGDRAAPVHIGIDIGDRGCALIAQKVPMTTRDVVGRQKQELGLLIVDQILTVDQSVDELCYQLKTQTDWNITQHGSTICTDPTTRRDELTALRKHFPGVRIVKRERGHDTFPIENGIRITQRALRDALGNIRLKFWADLAKPPYKALGVIDGIERYRRSETTGHAVKDNSRDHVLDALRYLTAEHVRPEKPETRVLQ